VPDICCELGHVGELSRLLGCPRLRHLAQRECQGLVVGVDSEGAALKHVPEVADTGNTGKQFPVKGGIPHMCRLKLFREKSERLPVRRRRSPLLQGCADMVGGSNTVTANSLLLWMCQQRGRAQSGPSGVESRHHRRCPVDRRRRLGAAPCRVGEGPQDLRHRWHKPSLEVEHS
jgi:hypothetical protein